MKLDTTGTIQVSPDGNTYSPATVNGCNSNLGVGPYFMYVTTSGEIQTV